MSLVPRELLKSWRWQVARLSRPGAPYDVLYVGPAQHCAHAQAVFAAETVEVVTAQALTAPNVTLVSHLPLPGTMKVPTQLHMVVPLDRPFEPRLHQRLSKRRARFSSAQAIELDDLERIHHDMLMPYAEEISLQSVRRIARGAGRLDVLSLDGEEVGCHLGYPREVNGFTHWMSLRFGYPKHVIGDQKRFADINSMNAFVVLEWAKASGFYALDLGACVARPRDGLLQWKRRRGGLPDATWHRHNLSVRMPRSARAELLWDHPLFSVEGDRLSLSLGLPGDRTDSEAAARFRELRMGGLASVALHAARVPGAALLEHLRRFCAGAELYVHGA